MPALLFLLLLLLLQIGYPLSLLSVYDGSWAEWAQRRQMEAPLGGPHDAPYPTLVLPPPTQEQQEALRAVVRARQGGKEAS